MKSNMPNKISNNFVLIMAGGSGTRLWPLSHNNKPKQFLDVLGIGKSLLRITFERASKLVPTKNIFIVAPKAYKELIIKELPISDKQLIQEPSAKNTAPCIYYSCSYINAINSNANLLIMPSDHLILNDQIFVESINQAFDFIKESNSIITFGIRPNKPETGYGYIEFEKGKEVFSKVKSFKEKPTSEVAQAYIDSGNYYWNSGIFMWKVPEFIKTFQKHSERISKCFNNINWGKADFESIKAAYRLCPNVSIDYEIMESADNIYTYKASFDWSDLGSWKSIFETQEKDRDNNVLIGNVVTKNVMNCLVHSSSKRNNYALLDLEDLIIVESEDTIMITKMNSDQRVKELKTKFQEDQYH